MRQTAWGADRRSTRPLAVQVVSVAGPFGCPVPSSAWSVPRQSGRQFRLYILNACHGHSSWPLLAYKCAEDAPQCSRSLVPFFSIHDSMLACGHSWCRYYILSISAGCVAAILITMDGEADAVRPSAYCAGQVATAMVLVIGLAWIDALPLHVCPQRVRFWAFAFVAGYKRELLTSIHSCPKNSALMHQNSSSHLHEFPCLSNDPRTRIFVYLAQDHHCCRLWLSPRL